MTSVFHELEIVPRQTADESALPIRDEDIDFDEAYVGAKGRRVLRDGR